MTLTMTELFGLLFAAAALSSTLTLIVIHVAFKYRIGPQIELRIDVRLMNGAKLLEESFRQRLMEALTGKSDVIRDRARDIARSGISLLSGRRPLRDDYDDEGDF